MDKHGIIYKLQYCAGFIQATSDCLSGIESQKDVAEGLTNIALDISDVVRVLIEEAENEDANGG